MPLLSFCADALSVKAKKMPASTIEMQFFLMTFDF
jgi:hypothetical protein